MTDVLQFLLLNDPAPEVLRLPYAASSQDWRGGGGWVVEYQNTRNKPSNTPIIILKLVKNIKIKKTTVYCSLLHSLF